MVSLLPVFILIALMVSLQVLGRSILSAGKIWLIASVGVFLVWALMIALRLINPPGLLIENWVAGSSTNLPITFQVSSEIWLLGFLLVSLLVAVVFFEAQHLGEGNYLNLLTGSIFITALGLVAVFSASGLAFLLTWAIIDLFEYPLLSWLTQNEEKHKTAVFGLMVRHTGILLLMGLVASGGFQNSLVEVGNVTFTTGAIILIIAFLRSGVFPRQNGFVDDPFNRRGIVTVLRFIPPVTAMAFLITTMDNSTPTEMNVVKAVLVLGMIISAFLWFSSKNELEGRSRWVSALMFLALYAFSIQSTLGVISSVLLLVIGGASLFLFSPRSRAMRIINSIAVISFLALPFTPSAGFQEVLWFDPFSLLNILMIAGYVLLLGGYLKHMMRTEPPSRQSETWMEFFHTSALVFLLISPWIGELFSFDLFRSSVQWRISIALGLFILAFTFVRVNRIPKEFSVASEKSIVISWIKPRLTGLATLLSFSWLYKTMSLSKKVLYASVRLTTRVLEGEGGILWSLLFLILLASIIFTRQVP